MTGSIGVPIYPTSTYAQDELGKPRMGYEYARVSNPTRDRLEKNLASLELGMGAKVFASGMAAVHAFCNMMKSGDHVLCTSNVYGGVPRLFDQLMANFGLEVTYVDTEDLDAVESAIRGNTRYLYAETPTNPLMALSDIAALAEIAHRHGVEMIVDNTFMSPYFQRPLELGADMVLHSTTKFLNGHSDGLGGAIVCSKREQLEKLAFVQKAAGAIMSPFECWLVLRGIKTLPVRMKQHDENGRLVADFLSTHRKVSKVFYPGLPGHPGHELAKRQMSGFGSMIAFETGSLRKRGAAAALFASVHPGRVAGRRRDADRAPGNHEPRIDWRRGAQGDGHQRWSAAPFGGTGRCGRHHRRPRAGAGVPVERTCVTFKST